MSDAPMLSNEAAMVLGLAGTAMPFARSPEEEAERWLRVLRLHGNVSSSLQAAGIGEVPVVPADETGHEGDATGAGRDAQQVVKSVTELATQAAERRGASAVGTVDVLVGAMDFYGDDFDRILENYGTDRSEVLNRALAAASSSPHESVEYEPLGDQDR